MCLLNTLSKCDDDGGIAAHLHTLREQTYMRVFISQEGRYWTFGGTENTLEQVFIQHGLKHVELYCPSPGNVFMSPCCDRHVVLPRKANRFEGSLYSLLSMDWRCIHTAPWWSARHHQIVWSDSSGVRLGRVRFAPSTKPCLRGAHSFVPRFRIWCVFTRVCNRSLRVAFDSLVKLDNTRRHI